MKKFSVKKIAAVILSAATVGTLSVGAAGCLTKSTDMTEPENVEITRLPVPDDGSLPTAHTCAENMAYIATVFDSQTKYHSYSYGVTSASIATQTTRTFRDYNDGVLLTTDLTYSSMVKSGSQTCTVFNEEGEGEVYFRVSEAPQADTLPSQAIWDEGAPTHFTEHAYHYTYGLLPTELFNYIVNEENIVDSEELKVNPDGTYTQNFTLDPVASTYFYQFGMKTRGGLSGYPEFQSITFSVTFDGDWRILSSDMHEVAMVNKGVVVSSISDFSTEYWYGDDHFDDAHFGYYDSYYKKYIGDKSLEEGGAVDAELVVDVTNVLSNGFSQIMNGGAQFEISADLGENTYKGYVFLSLDLADPLGTLALKASLGKSLDKQTFFVEYADGDMAAYYGKDFALEANLAEVKLAAGQFGELIEKITTALGGNNGESVETAPAETTPAETTEAEEGADPLTELMNTMVLVAGEKQAVLTLDTDDLLGLGIGINVRLVFGINNNEISFRGGAVKNLSIGGEELDLNVKISTTNAPLISHEKCDAPANLADYVSDVYALLGSDLIEVHAVMNGADEAVKASALKGINADVTAYLDITGLTVGAEAKVSYAIGGNALSATVKIWYGYTGEGYGNATLALTEFNGAPADVVLTCDVDDLVSAISSLVTTAGGDNGEATSGLIEIINTALSSDFSGLITEMYADKASIKMGVSVDTVLEMLGVKTDVKFGSCALKYHRGGDVYGGVLSAELPALGFNLSVSGAEGEIEEPDLTNALDLVYAINDIKALAESGTFALGLTLDGDAEGVTVPALGGIKATVNANLGLDGIVLSADAAISYTRGEDVISAKLSAWYEKGEGTGRIALNLSEINSRPLSVKAYCDIDELATAVKTLLGYAGLKTDVFAESGEATDMLSGALGNILGADFSALIPVLATDNGGLTIALNLDEALSLFDIDTGSKLGNLSLGYRRSTQDTDAAIVGSVPALGLSVNFGGGKEVPVFPDVKDYFDLTKLVDTVNAAWKEVNDIIDEGAVSFNIEKGKTHLSLDGIEVGIWGDGEVSWKKGREFVALDLNASIADGGAADVVKVKLIYDKNAVDTPIVRLALNEVGIDIYKDDIDTVTNGFNNIYSKISALIGGTDKQSGSDGGTAEKGAGENGEIPSEESATNNDKLMNLLFRVLSSGKWVDVLGDMTLTSDGRSVALSYLADNAINVKIGADGGLSLEYDGRFGSRFSLGGSLSVTAKAGGLADVIAREMEECRMSSSKTEGSAGFVKLAYDFLFDAINGVSVENILGSETYAVAFKLNGANTDVEELKNVFIDAQIYVTGEQNADNKGKIAEAVLDVNAAGVVIKLHVITERLGNNTHFYISLSQVMEIELPDLKFHATQESLYETLKVVISAVNDTDILDKLGSLMGGSQPAEKTETTDPAVPDNGNGKTEPVMEESAIDKVCGIISKLLDFNFREAVPATEDKDGVFSASLDLDNIMKQLGVEKTGSLGTVAVNINHNNHAMTTSGKTLVTDADGKTELKEWISLSSELTARRDYSKFDRNDYISIEFLPALIDDIVKTATDNGKMRTSFTLSGGINANLVGMIDVQINPCTVTVNLGDNGLTASVVMHVNKAKVLGIGIPESTVGITIGNGLLTLAKGLDGATPQYKVMTLDYFIDHMLTKNDSVLQWLLDISGWDLIMSFVKTDVSSGLTSPEDISLFEVTSSKDEQEISMYDYVKAISVIVGGNQTAKFGEWTALQDDLQVYDDYYGFALNAEKVTGGVLTKLNAAITRCAAGLDRVKASGAIQSYVTFSADLQFKNDVTEDYVLGSALAGDKKAPDLYAAAMDVADKCGYTSDFDHFVKKPDEGYDEVFGCLSVLYSDGKYSATEDYSHVLYSHTLTIVKADGTTETRSVRHGSTVHLYDNNSPVYTDESKTVRILYSTSQTAVVGTEVIMDGDLTVYAVKRDSVTVVVHSGSEEYIISSFKGDKVPTKVDGLDSIGTVTYQNGDAVGANDIIGDTDSVLHIYGTFIKTEVVVNYVKYTFDADALSYTASGKAAGFNDYYSVKGNTLVLENVINGYPVTAIAANAFADTEGKPIASVIVPENIVTVGEKAFLDNIGSLNITFLADRVHFLGSKKDKNLPLYGCSTEAEGIYNNITVYYKDIYCDAGGEWSYYRNKNSYDYYIGGHSAIYGDYGGALHSAGSWEYVDYAVNVDMNGVSGTLSVEAVSRVLDGFFPYVTTGTYADSKYESTVKAALEAALKDMNETRGGISYVCAYTTDMQTVNGKTVVTFNVTYKKSATVNIISPIAFSLYGNEVAANTLTTMTVPVDGEKIELATPPALQTHIFVGWHEEVKDGVTVYRAEWQVKEFMLKIRLTRGGIDTNIVHINSDALRVNGSGSKGTVDVTDIKIYGGDATFTLSNKKLTIVTNDVTYIIYVNEASVLGKDKNTQRNIKCSVMVSQDNMVEVNQDNPSATITIKENMELTFSY